MNYQYTLAVVIPCWNAEEFLPRVLDCILKQTYVDWRVICVDDCSIDNTANIIKSYSDIDCRIIYACRDRYPKGGQTCRNIGIELAKGAKFIMFFDADDLIAPYCFEQRVLFMENHNEFGCLFFPVLGFASNINESNGSVFGVRVFDDEIIALLNFNLPFSTWTGIYKYDEIETHLMKWDERIASLQDFDFSLQTVLSGIKYSFATAAKADYFYRANNSGVAGNIVNVKHFSSHLYLINKTVSSIRSKYGNQYDFYLQSWIVIFLGTFRPAWFPYLKLLKMPCFKDWFFFKIKILFFLLIFKMDRSFIFRKYRKFSKQQNQFWKFGMHLYRQLLIERGVNI